MKLCCFISRLQELNAYLEEFTLDTEGQETVLLPADVTMDIIYHSMPTMWKNRMIVEGFNYADATFKEMTVFLKSLNKRKHEDYDSSGVESSKEITVEHWLNRT